jgi:hypothetical protein
MSEGALKKPKSIRRIESKLEELEAGTLRYRVLDHCRLFKTAWIEFGEALFTAERQKNYREWGYLTFEGYCQKELGIRHATALKLLKSYTFLRNEEPEYLKELKKPKSNRLGDSRLPDMESVHLLRLAKSNKNVGEDKYQKIRTKVLEEADDARLVRNEIRSLSGLRPQNPSRFDFLQKLLGTLKRAKEVSSQYDLLPRRILQSLDDLSDEIRDEMKGQP